MFPARDEPLYEARPVTPTDAPAVQRLLDEAWHVYLRIPPTEVLTRLLSGLGWVAGEEERLSGFMLAEIQPPSLAFITAAALSDDWRVKPYLNTFLPPAERLIRQKGATALVHIGHAPWLTVALQEHRFTVRDWVLTYEWHYRPVTVAGNMSVSVRSAHLRDLPTLTRLDEQIFGPVWHKPAGSLVQALAQAFVFSVAEKEGQIVGYQWCDKYGRHGHLSRLAVRPGWEGQGVGTRLLTEALVALVAGGATWITLNTQESNLRSRMLYEQHGFRLTDYRVPVLWKDLSSDKLK